MLVSLRPCCPRQAALAPADGGVAVQPGPPLLLTNCPQVVPLAARSAAPAHRQRPCGSLAAARQAGVIAGVAAAACWAAVWLSPQPGWQTGVHQQARGAAAPAAAACQPNPRDRPTRRHWGLSGHQERVAAAAVPGKRRLRLPQRQRAARREVAGAAPRELPSLLPQSRGAPAQPAPRALRSPDAWKCSPGYVARAKWWHSSLGHRPSSKARAVSTKAGEVMSSPRTCMHSRCNIVMQTERNISALLLVFMTLLFLQAGRSYSHLQQLGDKVRCIR